VAVKSALADTGPLLFVGTRFAIAALVAAGVFLPRWRPRSGRLPDGSAAGPRASRARATAILYGIPVGLVLAFSYAAQTIGLQTTTPARSAFITALSVVLVPFWAWALYRRPPGVRPAIGLLLTLPGSWMLTRPDSGFWHSGDWWTLACAVAFGLHIVLVTRLGGKLETVGFLIGQLATTAGLALAVSWMVETPRLDLTPRLVGALLLTAVLATAVTNWLQIRLQPRLPASRTAVIFATEPVFAAVFSFLIIGETLGTAGWLGGALIVAGVIVSETEAR